MRAIEIFKDDFKNTIHQVIELIPGVELADHLSKNGVMDEENAKVIFKQILQGLEYMHGKGVVNRDIKPANIMLQEDQRTVIIDFNVSKAAPEDEENRSLRVFDDSYSPKAMHDEDRQDELTLAVSTP